MAQVAHLGVSQSSVKGSLCVMGIFLLQLDEVFRSVFPLPFVQIKTTELEGSLGINGATVCVSINTQSILQVVRTSWITLAQEHGLNVGLERALRHLGRFLNQLITRIGKRMIALVEYLIRQISMDLLQVS